MIQRTTSNKNNQLDPLLELVSQVGQLIGGQQATNSELARLNAELARLGAELDKKHEQNVALIQQRHDQNTAALDRHQKEDNEKFSKLTNALNRILWVSLGVCGLAGLLWTVLQFVVPLWLKHS